MKTKTLKLLLILIAATLFATMSLTSSASTPIVSQVSQSLIVTTTSLTAPTAYIGMISTAMDIQPQFSISDGTMVMTNSEEVHKAVSTSTLKVSFDEVVQTVQGKNYSWNDCMMVAVAEDNIVIVPDVVVSSYSTTVFAINDVLSGSGMIGVASESVKATSLSTSAFLSENFVSGIDVANGAFDLATSLTSSTMEFAGINVADSIHLSATLSTTSSQAQMQAPTPEVQYYLIV